jgi:hypothetical protein
MRVTLSQQSSTPQRTVTYWFSYARHVQLLPASKQAPKRNGKRRGPRTQLLSVGISAHVVLDFGTAHGMLTGEGVSIWTAAPYPKRLVRLAVQFLDMYETVVKHGINQRQMLRRILPVDQYDACSGRRRALARALQQLSNPVFGLNALHRADRILIWQHYHSAHADFRRDPFGVRAPQQQKEKEDR